MPGIGSTGLYIDDNQNEYAARVVGRTFKVENGKKIESGNFEVVATFRDGTERLVSDVPASKLFEPDAAPASPPSIPISTPPAT
jgi:hypothetical protein